MADNDEGGAPRNPLPMDPDLAGSAAPPFAWRILGAIAVGGALGAPARYGVAQIIHVGRHGFPWATFWTNVSGSLALGVLLVLILERYPPGRYARAFAATGFLGAYTTYSTFAVDTDVLVKDGHPLTAAAYVAASLVVGLGAAWLGVAAGRRMVSTR